jgi:hypothetical protein
MNAKSAIGLKIPVFFHYGKYVESLSLYIGSLLSFANGLRRV